MVRTSAFDASCGYDFKVGGRYLVFGNGTGNDIRVSQCSATQPYDGTVAWLDQALPEFERVLIRVALNRTHGHRQEAARVLGWGRNTLTRKLKELGMSDDESLP